MTVAGQPVIVAQGLSRRFGDIIAVDHLDLEVHPGEVFGFLGHNGAGKTTTVRLLNGVLAPSAGSARVLGYDPTANGPVLRSHTGVLTETPSLDERLTGRENLSIFADLYGVERGTVAARVEHLLELFELAERADEKVSAYSKGMKQRLALARALLHRPPLLFLDEPTAGLDPVATRRVHEMIHHLSREEARTVFLCTHNLTEAQRLCDRVAVLEHGKLVALGAPAELGRTLGRNQRVEIEVAPGSVAAARQVLVAIPGVEQVDGEGETLVVVGAGREAVPDLIAALVGAGVPIYHVGLQEASLEDVYFALHGESTRPGYSGEEEL
ncbi:MAG TPA: ABC transporter ATP-binding protein [Anaerolineae bacterium]|nr:ABC transporter ATP-binding protein [Anaerolineae bacterium]